MSADPRVYDSERLAQSYAFHRPPVHAAIWSRIASRLPSAHEVDAAIDLGCGAGASTLALGLRARRVTGVDASAAMLRRARMALPDATFVQGRSEALPFDCACCDLVSAAGSLNYSDPSTVLREVARILRPGGYFVAYDFSTGRVLGEDARAAESLDAFRAEFPPLPGYALDLKALPYRECGLDLTAHEAFEIDVPMTAEAYVDYLLGETNVEAALADGMSEVEARRLCEAMFAPLFHRQPRPVRFAAVFAIAGKTAHAGTRP